MEVGWVLLSPMMLAGLERQDIGLDLQIQQVEGISVLSKSNKANKQSKHMNPGNLRGKENKEIGDGEY